jgi:hypothetical protein
MKVSAARFGPPLAATRPRGARLLEARSPKLGRRVRLFDRLAFSQWIRLEADPAVLSFCERPARVDSQPDSCLIDFWIQRAGDFRKGTTLLRKAQESRLGAAWRPIAAVRSGTWDIFTCTFGTSFLCSKPVGQGCTGRWEPNQSLLRIAFGGR